MRTMRTWAMVASVWLAFLLAPSCGTPIEGVAVLVGVHGLPPEARSIAVTFKLDNQSPRQPKPFVVTTDLSRFAIALPPFGSNGSMLEITTQVQGADGCVVGTGKTRVLVPTGIRSLDASIDVTAAMGCPVAVDITGPATVSMPGGTVCGLYCSVVYARGQTVTLVGNLGARALGGQWGGQCSGSISTPCTFVASTGVTVSVTSELRQCNAYGVCAYGVPTGEQIQAVRDVSFHSAWAVSSTGDLLNTRAYPSWQVEPTNIPPGTPLKTLWTGTSGDLWVSTTSGSLFRGVAVAGSTNLVNQLIPAGAGTIVAIAQYTTANMAFVTDAGRIINFNGSVFTLDPFIAPGPINAVINSVVSPIQYWAVGTGFILQRNATVWSMVASPTGKNLRGVWTGFFNGTERGFAVGQGGIVLSLSGGGGGGVWSVMDPGSGPDLNAVWGTAFSNLWLVGDGGTVRHYDGSMWQDLGLPLLAVPPNLLSVHGSSASDVWFGGPGDTILGFQN